MGNRMVKRRLPAPEHALIVTAMRWSRITAILLFSTTLAAAGIAPDAVVLLYNSRVTESKALAETYAKARGIPADHLLGWEMPTTADITREEYQNAIAKPLRDTFDKRGLWRRGRDRQGIVAPVSNTVQALVTFKGVPLRIKQTPPPPANPGKPAPPPDPFKGHDEASVDSELAMCGMEGLPYEGPWQNKFFQSTASFSDAKMPFLILTARIDAPTYATCERMIRDAVETETTGLWGMCYVDIANKFPQGDVWMNEIATLSRATGIPTVVDKFNETFPAGYPMADAATYFGWYDWNPSGPLMDPAFRFRKGAVAVHLHSFSAEQLTNPGKNWCAPLLDRGAAATLGNVWEPYLHLTHHLSVFHKNLLAGDTLVEAAWKAMPATSWQGIVLGDPLYRPFLHLRGDGKITDQDRDYRAVRAAMLQYPRASERREKLATAISRTRSPVLSEALGLDFLADGSTPDAAQRFLATKALYPAQADQLRQDFHIIAIDREAGRKNLALKTLRDAQMRYPTLPGAQGVKAWINILDPPPPPPAPTDKK